MSAVIYKWPIPRGVQPNEPFTMEISKGAEVIEFATDPKGVLCIWTAQGAGVNMSVPRRFMIAFTGVPYDTDEFPKYVKSTHKDQLVLHLFELNS